MITGWIAILKDGVKPPRSKLVRGGACDPYVTTIQIVSCGC
jgi:hypothetical protein